MSEAFVERIARVMMNVAEAIARQVGSAVILIGALMWMIMPTPPTQSLGEEAVQGPEADWSLP